MKKLLGIAFLALLFGLGLVTGLFVLAVLIDPRALMLAGWVIGKGWQQPCQRDPVAAYVSGQYMGCKDSPLTKENVNKPIKGRDSCPLEWAVLYGRIDTTRELLGLGASQQACGHSNKQLLVEVFRRCDHMEQFLAEYARAGILPNAADADDYLFEAAREDCPQGAAAALQLGASVSARDRRNRTPLSYVVSSATDENIELARMLVAHGADIQEMTPEGETLYQSAERVLSGAGNWPRMKAALLGEEVQGRAPPSTNAVGAGQGR